MKGFTTLGNLDEVLTLIQTDETVAGNWQTAREIEDNVMEPNWFPHTVKRDSDVMLQIKKSMLALTRQQVIDVLGGFTPESVGIKLDNLQDEQLQPFKGLLVTDPAEPQLKYVLVRQVAIKLSEVAMPSGSQLYRDQPKQTFDFKLGELESEKEFGVAFTKMRTSPHSMSSLAAKLEAHRKKVDVGNRNSGPLEDTGADASGEGGAAGASGDLAHLTPTRPAGPVLNHRNFMESC